jgi:hypothetical protein
MPRAQGLSRQLSGKSDRHEDETVAEVARQVGIGSGRTYERHRNTLAEAERVAPDVAAKAEAGEATMRDVAKAVRQAKKAERVADLTANNPTVAIGIYTTIAIDPPWQYDNTATRAAAADHYPTMSLDELADLYVPAADDAHLYLWVTNPFLPDAFRLLGGQGHEQRVNRAEAVEERVQIAGGAHAEVRLEVGGERAAHLGDELAVHGVPLLAEGLHLVVGRGGGRSVGGHRDLLGVPVTAGAVCAAPGHLCCRDASCAPSRKVSRGTESIAESDDTPTAAIGHPRASTPRRTGRVPMGALAPPTRSYAHGASS